MTGPAGEGFGVVASLAELVALGHRIPLARGRPAPGPAPGGHGSARLSRGMEFAESRPYQAGDDVRAVDWRQTARRGRLYTKLFQEEHERPVCLLADLGPAMRFGTRGAFKAVQAARAAAWLAWAAAAGGDRVGGMVCNGAFRREIRPQAKRPGVLGLLRCLAEVSAAPPGPAQGLAAPLGALGRTLRPGSRVVVLSDFSGLEREAEGLLAALGRGRELALVHVYDPFEAEAPPPGCYRLTDGRAGLTLDLRSGPARAAWTAAFAARRAGLEELARRSGAALVPLPTHGDPAAALLPLAHR